MRLPANAAIRAYGVTLAVLVIVDMLWIVAVAAPLFRSTLGSHLREQPDILAAVLFYAVYAAGLTALAVVPAAGSRSLRAAAIKGGILGLTAYATFDLTNVAILARWTWTLAITDIAWGTFVSALAAAAGCLMLLRGMGPAATGVQDE